MMDNHRTNRAVRGAVSGDVWRAVDLAIPNDVGGVVYWALTGVMNSGSGVVFRAVDLAVYGAGHPSHPALQDFLRFASAGVVW